MAKKEESVEERRNRLRVHIDARTVPPEEFEEWDDWGDDETTDIIDLSLARLERTTKECNSSLKKAIDDISKAGEDVQEEVEKLRKGSDPNMPAVKPEPKKVAGD